MSLKVEDRGISIPADGRSFRRIYLYNVFDLFGIQILGCVGAFPYGYSLAMMDFDNGVAYLEVGPVPEDQADKLFFILIGDIADGRGYRIPIMTTYPAKRIA